MERTIRRHRQKPVILPRPPKGYGGMPNMVRQAMTAAILADSDLVHGLHLDAELQSRKTHDGKLLLIWQIANPQRWAECDCRTMFITKELADAMQRTRAHVKEHGLSGSDLHFRLPSFMIWWPTGCDWLDDPVNGIRITHTIVSCYEHGEYPVAYLWSGGLTMDNDTVGTMDLKNAGVIGIPMRWPGDAKGLLISSFWNNGEVSSGSLNLEQPIEEALGKFAGNTLKSERTLTKDSVDSWKAGTSVMEVVLNLTLLMQSYPEYVTQETMKHRHYDGGREKKTEMRRAYVLGHAFAPQKIVKLQTVQQPGDGTGKHQRPHWREGHWRRQPHGDRWELENDDKLESERVSIVTDHKGRRCHMKWIMSLWIDAASHASKGDST